MNVENILKVADAIERHEVSGLGFNMGIVCGTDMTDQSGHNCGTVACIAGWANAIRTDQKSIDRKSVFNLRGSRDAGHWLGIDEEKQDELFYMETETAGDQGMSSVKSTQAVAVLRHLAATGEVDWSISA